MTLIIVDQKVPSDLVKMIFTLLEGWMSAQKAELKKHVRI